MSEYTRTTRECSFAELRPDHISAIRKYAEKHGFGDMESSITACFETVSTKVKKGFFSSKIVTTVTGIVLTYDRLIWSAAENDEVPAVLAPRLRDIHVQDYEATDMFRLMNDSGVNVSGPLSDSVRPSTAFIGLGPELASQSFRDLLKTAAG